MDSRERLARVLCARNSRGIFDHQIHLVAWQLVGEAYEEADAILASDWLRDTLAAERVKERKAIGDRLEQWGDEMACDMAAAIRNLAPEASDDRG